MTNIYYVYRYKTDRKGARYTPSHTLQAAYPEWAGLVTIVDEKIVTNTPLWKRSGWIECDDTIAAEVITEITDNGVWAMMKILTSAEAIGYLQAYTDYPESPVGTFELSPETTEGEVIAPAVTLTIV